MMYDEHRRLTEICDRKRRPFSPPPSPLLTTAGSINRRLRRVCSLLHEPATVDSPPSLAYWLSTLPTREEVFWRIDAASRAA